MHKEVVVGTEVHSHFHWRLRIKIEGRELNVGQANANKIHICTCPLITARYEPKYLIEKTQMTKLARSVCVNPAVSRLSGYNKILTRGFHWQYGHLMSHTFTRICFMDFSAACKYNKLHGLLNIGIFWSKNADDKVKQSRMTTIK
jgi:hypothetical protein